MASLPLIVGLGGINAAGRSSGFHSYKRMIESALSDEQLALTWQDLANRMGLADEAVTQETIETIKAGTLIRRLETFDPDNVPYHYRASLSANSDAQFVMKKSKAPESAPDSWSIDPVEGTRNVSISINEEHDVLLPGTYKFGVTSAGNLPTGFDPATLYNSRYHPRGMAMTIYGVSDTLNSLGFEWQEVMAEINPDQVSVYAGTAFCQMDDYSMRGLIAAPLLGERASSKMIAMSLAEMPADFINGYVIDSVGTTGTNMGACATFLYNLRQACDDIKRGTSRVAVVGGAEALVNPEIMEGFRIMGALTQDEELCKLDGSDTADNRRACRPFSTNAGFTIAEASQFVVVMEESLALELGATVYGSVADVFINADANKKSISAPGVGNYVTVAKATALAKAILGEDGVKKTFVQAHGTGTPQNRVTESHILNEVAKTFSIEAWPVCAVKSYVGHSVGTAAGDQLLSTLGVWQYGWLPGIKTIDHIAEDVHNSNLNILMDHHYAGEKGEDMLASIINSKGFGGNNASALILSPQQTLKMLEAKYGSQAICQYWEKNKAVTEKTVAYDKAAAEGNETMIYSFGENVMTEHDVTMTLEGVSLTAFKNTISLAVENPFAEYES